MDLKQLQDEYRNAKAELDKLDTMKSEIEKRFIINKRIVNADGSIPQAISDIIDNNVMYNIIADFAQHIEQNGLWDQITTAQDQYNKAGDDLINYMISIAPEDKQQALIRTSENYERRMQIINIALCL